MREILFRGKRKDDKWVFGDLVTTQNICISNNWHEVIRVKDETVGQFTGLTDKNGTKIFEGDIVKDGFGRIMKVVFIERWGKYQFTLVKATGERWTNNFIRADLTDWFIGGCSEELPEIIGNIYDNPELLESAK